MGCQNLVHNMALHMSACAQQFTCADYLQWLYKVWKRVVLRFDMAAEPLAGAMMLRMQLMAVL